MIFSTSLALGVNLAKRLVRFDVIVEMFTRVR